MTGTTASSRSFIQRALHFLVHAQLGIAGLLFAIVVALNTVEVTQRYLFGNSFIWIQDVTILLVSWMAFLGYSSVVYLDRDIRLGFVVDRLPYRWKSLAGLLVGFISVPFLAVFSWKSFTLQKRLAGSASHVIAIPMPYYIWPLVVMGLTLFILWLVLIPRLFSRVIRGSDPKSEGGESK